MRIDIKLNDLLPPLQCAPQPLAASQYERYDAVLQVTAAGAASQTLPHEELFAAAMRRRQPGAAAKKKADSKAAGEEEDREDWPMVMLPGGTAICRVALPHKSAADNFTRQQILRESLEILLARMPRSLAVDIRARDAEKIAYTVLTAAAKLPAAAKKTKQPKPLSVMLAGMQSALAQQERLAAQANALTRALVQLPPNELTPPQFAACSSALAKEAGLSVKRYDLPALKKLGAGAICAVGKAAEHPPCVVRLSYTPPRGKGGASSSSSAAAAVPRVALVGKGVCYDTGGVNVKPARHMRGMGRDMAGAAAALGAMMAAAQLKLPLAVDCWLALAENSIAANAYRPDDVITAANGKRIEIVHSDAEGRMLLADTLTLASRAAPAPTLLITYATLTGTMCTALGFRMSGFFATHDSARKAALQAADDSGERLCYFPMPADYRQALKSEVADIKQCSEDGEADHILAALFLREFISGAPQWLHLDLSSAECKGGLGAAPGEITGFGAAWTLALLARLCR